jgi:hypothetical protein
LVICQIYIYKDRLGSLPPVILLLKFMPWSTPTRQCLKSCAKSKVNEMSAIPIRT